jgi:hypothetical protein
VGDLHGHRHAAQQHNLMAPIKLVGFPGRKAQWYVGCGRHLSTRLGPSPGVATDRIVAAVIPTLAQFLEHADQRELFAGRLDRVARQQRVESFCPSSELRSRLDFSFVFERCLTRPQHLANRVPRDLQVPRDFLNRLALDEVLAPYPRYCLHDQHPLATAFESKREACYGHTSGGHFWMPIPRLRGSDDMTEVREAENTVVRLTMCK